MILSHHRPNTHPNTVFTEVQPLPFYDVSTSPNTLTPGVFFFFFLIKMYRDDSG